MLPRLLAQKINKRDMDIVQSDIDREIMPCLVTSGKASHRGREELVERSGSQLAISDGETVSQAIQSFIIDPKRL